MLFFLSAFVAAVPTIAFLEWLSASRTTLGLAYARLIGHAAASTRTDVVWAFHDVSITRAFLRREKTPKNILFFEICTHFWT